MNKLRFTILLSCMGFFALSSNAVPSSKEQCHKLFTYCQNTDMSGATIAWNEYLHCIRFQGKVRPCSKEAENMVTRWNEAVDFCQKCHGINGPVSACNQDSTFIQCLPKLPPINKG